MLIYIFLSIVHSARRNSEGMKSKSRNNKNRFSMEISTCSSFVETTSRRSSIFSGETSEAPKFLSLPNVHRKTSSLNRKLPTNFIIQVDSSDSERINLDPISHENNDLETGNLKMQSSRKNKKESKKNKIKRILAGCKCFAKTLKWITFFVLLIMVALSALRFDNQIGWVGSYVIGNPSLTRTLSIVFIFVAIYITTWRCLCQYKN